MKERFLVCLGRYQYIMLFFLTVIAVGSVFTARDGAQQMAVSFPAGARSIVLDAGHGGFDPGKKGTTGVDEKELNLAIVLFLQQYLEQAGATVYLTRDTDEALGKSKQADMARRKNLADENEADLFISIHQNSFPAASAQGAQVFYHGKSPEGKRLAECIQETLRQFAAPNNKREPKANTSYYILRKTTVPAAIVECGFLSNRQEEAMLNDPGYQQKIAWGIFTGILTYFAEEGEGAV